MTGPPKPRQGEVWQVTLDPTLGEEMAKTRPCVVVSGDTIGRLALRVVVPITDWKDRYSAYPWMTRLDPMLESGLHKTSAADAFQIRSVSLARFLNPIGKLPDERVDRISRSVALSVRTPRTNLRP